MDPGKRARGFAFLLYPESAPDDFESFLEGLHVKGAISPLHDRDVTEDGALKKPHWHVELYFGGKKSVSQVLDLVKDLGVEHVETLNDIKAYTRYLAHLDSPDKFQYSPEAIRGFGGANVRDWLLDGADYGPDLRRLIREYSMTSYAEVMDYCDENRPDWARWAQDHTIHLKGYLSACGWEGKKR